MFPDNVVTGRNRVHAIVFLIHTWPGRIIYEMAVEVEVGDVQNVGYLGIGSAQLADAAGWEVSDDGLRGAEGLARIICWWRADPKRWFPCGRRHQHAAGHSDGPFQRFTPAEPLQFCTVIGAE